MNRLCLAIGCIVATTSASFAMTDDECKANWKKLDANADGVLSESESAASYTALRTANKTVADGKLDQAVYLQHCKEGLFTTAANNPGAPLKGENSFTEAQAKERAARAGFNDVSALKKDDDGIWRGTANTGGKSVSIAIDYKGNVVAQ